MTTRFNRSPKQHSEFRNGIGHIPIFATLLRATIGRIAAFSIMMMPTLSTAAECTAHSGHQTAAVVELYTSEGCNSCPPADRWLSSLKTQKNMLIVPLAFHVDYWDHIGWRDRFATPAYSARQRQRVRAQGGSVVYTPQVMLDGEDFRNWHSSTSFHDAVARINARAPQATINLHVKNAHINTWQIQLGATLIGKQDNTVAYLALLEHNLSSAVTAGENDGKQLRHDFVVRQWLGPFAFDNQGQLNISRTVQRPEAKSEALHIAAVVQNVISGQSLQALLMSVCR